MPNRSKAVIGLGNPGPRYMFTRHNIGFLAIDRYLDNHAKRISEKSGKFSEIFEVGKNILAKPTTFMNRSGIAIGEIYAQYQIPPQEMLIVFDDYSLPFGTLRLRKKGGDGGQNGMKSIIELVGSEEIPRLRLGISDETSRESLTDYVLGEYSHDQQNQLDRFLDRAAAAIDAFLYDGIESAMNRFNVSG